MTEFLKQEPFSDSNAVPWPRSAGQPWVCFGFTLVEMLLVVVMLATLASTLAVSLGGRQDRYTIRLNAKDLAAAIWFASEQARLRGVPHRVVFVEDMCCYRVESDESGIGQDFVAVHGNAGRTRRLAGGVYVAAVSRDGEDLGNTSLVMAYDARGNGFFGTVQLGNRRGDEITIEVAPETGQVRVIE